MVKNKVLGVSTDFSKRILEKDEIISGEEGILYAHRKDNRTLTFELVATDIIEKLNINDKMNILEVCCGAGQLVHFLYLLTGNKNIIATDGSKELIESAKSTYGNEPIKFEVQNIHTHSYKSKFDAVICKDSFHHFKNHTDSLKEMFSLVKKGGVVYIWDLNRECPHKQYSYRASTIASIHERERFLHSLNASLTADEMKEVALNAGASNFDVFYPFTFSKTNLKRHSKQIQEDKVKEFELNRLFAIYVIKK